MRRAAAAAVGATLSAAVATIVTDGPPATVQAVRSPELSPSAMDPFMPVSVERPTGVHPASAHRAPANTAGTRTAATRTAGTRTAGTRTAAIDTVAARSAGSRRVVPVAGAGRPTASRGDSARVGLSAARVGMSIGRLDAVSVRPGRGER